MRYISIDPATKSIAVCCIDLQDKDLNGFDQSIRSLSKCDVISAFAIDLAPSKLNKDITTLERVKLINTFVESYVTPLIIDNTTIIIEDQIGTTKTYVSFIALISALIKYNVTIIKPSKKNQLTIGGNSITDFYKKYIIFFKREYVFLLYFILTFPFSLSAKTSSRVVISFLITITLPFFISSVFNGSSTFSPTG